MSQKKIIGFKGFDKDLKCNGFQYEVGKESTINEKIKLCSKGLHFCEHPFDVFNYYSPAKSRFAQIEASNVTDEKDSDSKRVAKTLKITTELSLHNYIDVGIKFILNKVDYTKKTENKLEKKAASNSGDYGAASNSGDYGAASNSGDYGAASNSGIRGAASNSGYSGAASNSGDYGAASNSGDQGIAMSVGIDSKAMGKKGTWIVLSEWKYNKKWERIDTKAIFIDGKKIKENTWYKLINGEFVAQ